MVKIGNKRFIIYCNNTNDIELWKLNDNHSLKWSSKAQLLKELRYSERINDILVLNKDTIILEFKDNHNLYFWKINEDNTLTNVFNIEIGDKFNHKSFLKYDNILFVQMYHSIYLINLNNYQFVKKIEYLKDMCCMTKLMNGNILLGIKGKNGYDIVECKFNKTTYDLTKLKLIANAYYKEISKIIEMENGNIISYQKDNDLIVIWNRKEDLK